MKSTKLKTKHNNKCICLQKIEEFDWMSGRYIISCFRENRNKNSPS